MQRDEITELFETRRNAVEDDDITVGQDYQVVFDIEDDEPEPRQATGNLSIEYKPEDLRLVENGLDELGSRGYFRKTGNPERIISEIYWALVHVLYPGSAYLDEPWENLPLVVSLEYETSDFEDFYVSLGSYR